MPRQKSKTYTSHGKDSDPVPTAARRSKGNANEVSRDASETGTARRRKALVTGGPSRPASARGRRLARRDLSGRRTGQRARGEASWECLAKLDSPA